MPCRAIWRRGDPGDVLAGERDLPGVGAVRAGGRVEARGLARAVGTHDAVDLARGDLEADVLQRVSVAKTSPPCATNNAVDRCALRAARSACQIPAMPSGLNDAIAMNASPYQSGQVCR